MQDKKSIRKDILAKRDSIPPEVRRIKNRMIQDRLSGLDEFKKAGVIFFFASFRSEVDTSGMIGIALEQGKRVILPKVEGQSLGLYEIKSIDELIAGYMGIPEPIVLTDDRKMSIDTVDAVIIPGAAFDESGNRIGYGGGYYDRLLADLEEYIPIIAPAYEEQIVGSVPAEPHDRKVGIIVTDRREIRCST